VTVTALPDDAIIDYQGRKYIFTPANVQHQKNSAEDPKQHQAENHFQMIEVTTGASESGYTEVTLPGDFDRNSDVVVAGGYAILAKMKNTTEEE
jgi:cobalt-zinc-cadmium efflux system membrane fusion protein